jgi:hypothetical protein
MDRRKIVRLELLLLAVVTLLLAYRVVDGPQPPDGLVVYADLNPDELVHASLTVDRPVQIAVEGIGSFESEESGPAARLAAYGWLLRRENREVVWSMDPAAAGRDRTLAVTRDTIELSPGTYEVFYASFGNRIEGRFGLSILNRLLGERGAWRGDADRWRLILRTLDGQPGGAHLLGSQSTAALSPAQDGMIWSTAPMEGSESGEFVFQLAEPARIRAYAVGEIDNRQMDYGWIDDAVTGERMWEMTLENTEPAGGWDVNRLFAGAIELPPGIYRAACETDARHAYGDWLGNPPVDPAAWGLTLYADAEEAVAPFDPWTMRAPIVQIDRVGDDERRTVQFRVRRPIQIAASVLGELGDNGRYDYAWIRDNESQTTVWEMTAERSQPAGGRNNRRELAFLTLEPSTYSVTYETDDSHSFESWRHGSPDHPERWGVTLFAVQEDVDSTAVEVLGASQEDLSASARTEDGAPPPPPTGPQADLPDLPGEAIVELTRLGNEQHVSRSFTLESPRVLQIRALGEISLSAPYDYGWIEHAETGEIIWQMTWQNTIPAGGGDQNRMFDGTLSLGPGAYVAHFRTDFSHAYGDFGDDAPHFPDAWGIAIVNPEPTAL